MKFKYWQTWGVVLAALLLSVPVFSNNANAARDQGPDWSKFQGPNGVKGYDSDKFVLCQLGGTYGGTLIDQWTYTSQLATAKNMGLRTHTYIWYGVGGSIQLGQMALDYYLPKVQTPKGSIVALDYEDGASASVADNTDAILYGMRRIAAAGYTPMYYSYKPYTLNHVDYHRIIKEFPNSLWMAAYPDYQVRNQPYYGVFPTMDGVALYQFTSTYVAGGLDGNVDLLNITQNGYNKKPQIPNPPQTVTPKPQTTNKWIDALGDTWHAEKGTYTVRDASYLRWGARKNSTALSLVTYGSHIKYDAYSIHSGYVWIRQPRANGTFAYIATGAAPYGWRTDYWGDFQ